MPTKQWDHRLELKDLLTEDDSHDAVVVAAKEMHERLEKFRIEYYPNDDDLAQISDEFHTIAFIDGPAGSADAIKFDHIMDYLYDWCDQDKRVWVD